MENLENFQSPHLEDLQRKILTGIVSCFALSDNLTDRISFAHQYILEEFMEGSYLLIWKLVSKYYLKTGGIPYPESLDEMLQGVNSISLSEKIRLKDAYIEFSVATISLTEYRLSVIRLGERWREERYSEILSFATRINLSSLTDQGTLYAGMEDSQVYLRDKLHDLELSSRKQNEILETEINYGAGQTLSTYREAKETKETGTLTGIGPIDELTNGFHPGELIIVAAYTSEGKSKLVYNAVYNSCYIQGKNIILGSNEATIAQVRLNIVIRHSHHPKFQGRTPLKYTATKYGRLTPEEESFFGIILDDMKRCKDYGKMHIYQMPSRASLEYVGEILRRKVRDWPVDLCVVDYLGLMSTSNHRNSRREELDDVIVQAKMLALEHHIPFLSPWQVSRSAYESALMEGGYTKYAMAETAQTERHADVIIALLNTQRQVNRLMCQLLKNRDGEVGSKFDLITDFSSCYISDLNLLERI